MSVLCRIDDVHDKTVVGFNMSAQMRVFLNAYTHHTHHARSRADTPARTCSPGSTWRTTVAPISSRSKKGEVSHAQ